MPKVIIAICAYNVEETLEKTIAHMPENIADEIIVVDDGSSDRTVELARKLEETLNLRVIVHPENRGYGAVQKTAYAAAIERGADVIALLHGDFQYDPASLPLLISPLLAHGADMTFGSRFASDGDPRAGGMPMYRFVGNRITTVLENVMIGTRFTDMHSGMRAFNRRCLLFLPFLAYRNDFAFDKQTTVDAVMSGLRVTEIPIPTRYDHESSSIPTIGSFRYVWHSLVYTFKAARERGKRGRRWQVTGRRALTAAQGEVSAATLWEFAAAYLTPNRRAAIAGFVDPGAHIEMGRRQGWDVDDVTTLGDAADLGLVFADRLTSQGRELLGRIHPEGLLVAVVRNPGLRGLLDEQGFRIVGWHPSGIVAARREPARSQS